MMAYHQGFPSHLATLNQWLVIGKSPPHRKDQLWSKTSSAGSAVIVSTRPSNCSDVVRLADRQTVHTQDIVSGGDVKIEIGLGKTQQEILACKIQAQCITDGERQRLVDQGFHFSSAERFQLADCLDDFRFRSEGHPSELQSLLRISY